MTATLGSPHTRPVVAMLYRLPLFAEAPHGIFDGSADLHTVHARVDPESLFRWLRPDALVLDSDADRFPVSRASEMGSTVVRVWKVRTTDSSPNTVRNVVLTGLIEERRT